MKFLLKYISACLALGMAFAGCGLQSESADLPAAVEGEWYQPAAGTSWQWQLVGALNDAYDAEIYDIDLETNDAGVIQALQGAGKRVICYFSAGTYEDFRGDSDQFPEEALGNALEDFPDERWLDIRSEAIRPIIEARLDLAVTKGCDGVEPDNVDGYSNDNGFGFSADDQLAYNTFIANAAHERGLSVGLKNDLDQVEVLEPYFDFAVNEQCHQYDECDLLTPFIEADKAVLNAEYNASYRNNAVTRNQLCVDASERNFSTLILPVDLDDSFRLECLN